MQSPNVSSAAALYCKSTSPKESGSFHPCSGSSRGGPMFSDAFRCFPMLSNISRCFPMPFRCPGRRGTSKQMHFEGSLLPFRCLSDVFPMPFRCVFDASDGISDVCSALSDVSNVFLFSLNVRCFSCFECLTVKICKGRGAMFSDDTGAGFISEKNCGFPQIFAKSWNSFFSA